VPKWTKLPLWLSATEHDLAFLTNSYSSALGEGLETGSVQAVDLLVARWDRAHFDVMIWELILEPERCLQCIRKAAIRRFCVSVDLKNKPLMRHVMM
jgi:hypothetical protein